MSILRERSSDIESMQLYIQLSSKSKTFIVAS